MRAGSLLILSGTTGADPATGALSDGLEAQTRQALSNCGAILAAAGVSAADVVEVGILLDDPEDLAAMNAVYAGWITGPPPARFVAKLGVSVPDLLISIRMTAKVD
ncbi:RidA family protein [Amnibacterium sp. CER49]|uniref:RidA family protein n=1 Tax=Amnibacterium sp. CER49 TaxID=3039161 RepID=UPI002446C3A0|nr:RidA family protein [Amnibacterium sp. CER49]MDH2442580.1 RidA family protein [Amnibacterium sp. CER49]